MESWTSGWGQTRTKATEPESFRITKVKAMDGAINAEMFNQVGAGMARPARPVVRADANGGDLLK